MWWLGFNPLYRGTWFPTRCTTPAVQGARRGFNPLYRGTWFPTAEPGKILRPNQSWFQSAISRYLVSNTVQWLTDGDACWKFQSAISRYLVSNCRTWQNSTTKSKLVSIRYIAVLGFQHCSMVNRWRCVLEVSIRYIAVLGFQHVLVDGDRVFIRVFQSAISRYLVSNHYHHASPNDGEGVSIRYIAVLGFQPR